MRTRRMLRIRKAQGEEGRGKHLTTGKCLRAQAGEGKRKRKQKTTNPAVKTGRQGEIQRRRTRTSITKVRPRKGLDPEARAKAKRCQKVRRGTPGTANTKKRKLDWEARKGTMRRRGTKRNTMIFVEERGAEVRRRIKEENLKVTVRITLKVKTGKNTPSQRVKNANNPKANTAQIVRPESEAKAEREGSVPGPEVKNENGAEVKIIPNTRIRN